MTTEEKLIKVAQNTTDAIEENKKIGSALNQNQSNSIKQNKEKLIELNSELEQTLYGTDTGGKSYYDEVWDSLAEGNKIIPKTINGNPVFATDVSEIPHNLSVKLTSDIIEDFSDVEVVQTGKNIYGYIKPNVSNGTIIEKLENGAIVQGNQADETVAHSLSNRGSFNSGITSASAICPKVFGGQIITISADVTLLEIGNSPKPNQFVPYIYIQGAQSSYYGGEINLTLNVKQRVKAVFTIKEEHSGKIIYPVFRLNSNKLRIENIQFECNNTATEYEPYKEYKATADSSGIVEGLKSISPITHLYSNADVDIELTYNKSWGMDYEEQELWKMLLNEGKKNFFTGFFYDSSFEYIRPPYVIKPTSTVSNMFRGNPNLKIIEKDYFDFSNIITSLTSSSNGYFSTFYGCSNLEEIQDCNFLASYLYRTFCNCSKLKKIEKWKFAKDGGISNDAFYGCTSLEELGVVGEIGKSINFSDCPLSKASITNILEHLCADTDVTGQTLTLKESAVNAAFTTEEWAALEATKTNWTINLV